MALWRQRALVRGLAVALLARAGLTVAAEPVFVVTPEDYPRVAVLVPADADPVKWYAAQELQAHLRLVTGTTFPIRAGAAPEGPAFLVGTVPPSDREPLATEEGRYLVTPEAVYLYGDDRVRRAGADTFRTVVSSPGAAFNHVGTLFAVYDFLERELGVRWLEPGDDGVFYAERPALRLAAGGHRWVSPFAFQRNLRSYAWREADTDPGYVPAAFVLSPAQAQARRDELDLWLRRMRMGAKEYLEFDHAFHDWWGRYGQEHPEYFAVNGRGGREPLFADRPDRVQTCCSEPGVVRQAVANWLERRQTDTLSTRAVCVALNDGGGGGAAEYCHCPKCLALDQRVAGAALDDHLTDRYLHLANQTLTAARQQVPGALVTAYAYASTLLPPRRLRVADGVVLQVVTALNTPLAQTEALYACWQARGATRLMFRPNDLCVELGLPLGLEQRLVEHQRIALRHGALGTDHDAVYGFWTGVSGLGYYALARAHIDTAASFAAWEDEYTAAFGAAQPEVRALFAHWRRRFDEAIAPADLAAQATETGLRREGFLAWHRLSAMSRDIGRFYREEDFDHADDLLQQALARELTALQRRQVQRLVLANQHSRLTFRAMRAVSRGDDELTLQEARRLLDYRVAVRDSLDYNWWLLFSEQHQMGDATGIALLLKQDRLAGRTAHRCARLAARPVIDGRPDEPAWDGARLAVGFVDNQTAAAPNQDTRTWLGYDDEALYLAVECLEPHLDRAVEKVTTRDGEAWQDNAVEIFLDPTSSKEDFYQFIVTSAGALLDGRRQGGPFAVDWDPELGRELEYAAGRADSAWAVEVRLPFRSLGLAAPQPGDRLRFNLTRDRNVVGEPPEATALSPTFGGFHLPQRFAVLTLDPAGPLNVSGIMRRPSHSPVPGPPRPVTAPVPVGRLAPPARPRPEGSAPTGRPGHGSCLGAPAETAVPRAPGAPLRSCSRRSAAPPGRPARPPPCS